MRIVSEKSAVTPICFAFWQKFICLAGWQVYNKYVRRNILAANVLNC